MERNGGGETSTGARQSKKAGEERDLHAYLKAYNVEIGDVTTLEKRVRNGQEGAVSPCSVTSLVRGAWATKVRQHVGCVSALPTSHVSLCFPDITFSARLVPPKCSSLLAVPTQSL